MSAMPVTEIDLLQSGLESLRRGDTSAAAFSGQARHLAALLDGLPPRFGEVLDQLLDRLEASALFTEESCSFSQSDLLDNLQLWIDKARAAPRA
ncbi:hypothetical protein FN976_02350 [Caenimonas sedimenti]|uniref:Uncharacterized protein n=2 Tax=Caenimonas sedimenti TaxID=2596921 RepID=A0A562ZYI7_9BURK|nr:hypothetical protein [Caenimonas sedimenti]TWO73264.1 hypothetical protein FN976_02350 [Caenimonas sedimenti]